MKRHLLLLLLVAGCTATPVATPPDTVSRTPTTTTTVATTSPRIDTPRKLPADPCLLLTAADFDTPLSDTPQPYPNMPRSCVFREGSGAETDLIVLVVFADAYVRPADTMEMLVGDGHSAASSCVTGSGVVECTTLVAVNATESFKVIAHLRNGNPDQVASLSQGYAKSAFKRVLVTS
ncbi:hypothetical protein SK803_25210 [Lentzea sp. BCCO 10_0856]|uniref:DUF3558 domain-containing protein n=1 Tax=Lentzea miocenica TaxID=3095431 RepID=A0ABU4T5T7_9PSEU|nr:hypothetical protein [Lentzea sp. BCCO 10_0856]MDX8033532.1 hypothetical protein [Lentzea sp. BCCO 10_0856]